MAELKIRKNTVRSKLYWFSDLLKGGPVKHNYKEIDYLLNNPLSEKAISLKEKYLRDILHHSAAFPYFKYLNGSWSLTDYPVINKNIIKENLTGFFVDPGSIGKFHKVTTSGSTGAPFTIWQDHRKRLRHTAENIYFSEIAGYQLGTRLYYLRVWNEINKKNLIESKAQNIIMYDASDLSESRLESFIVSLENDISDKSVLAFSSTFEALAKYISRSSRLIKAQVTSFITISETLPEGARQILKSAFNCPVISRYSNMENGFLAQQCGESGGEYHLNTAGFYFEILHPEKDEPVSKNETGRIVVTDLFNYAMPLIRYDTGDMAVLSTTAACCFQEPVFKCIEGRKVDFIYGTNGNLLSPHVVTNTMWKYSQDVSQFQFIQNDTDNYVLKLNLTNGVFGRETEIKQDLRNFLGQEADIKIEYVDGIPALSSGKRKKIINNYKQDWNEY